MRMGSRVAALCAVVCVHASAGAYAQATARTITLAEVLARAREQAPRIVSARLAVEEARGRRLGASLRQDNPELTTMLGSRNGPEARFTDVEVGVGQRFEPPSRRAARVAGADAAVALAGADADAVTRDVLHLAAATCVQVLHAQARIALLDDTRVVAASVLSIAERRFAAGDIAILDVNLARASLARLMSDREAAEASRTAAVGDLQRLLGLDGDLRVDGSLIRPDEPDLAALLAAAPQRPDLRGLDAAVREADAEARLGRTFERPEYGLDIRYAREEGDQILRGGVTISLPVFARGQELQAVGSARAARLRATRDATLAQIARDVRSAFDVHARRRTALRVLDQDVLPGLDENQRLMTRSFDVGQIGLPDLLLIRREILETRSQYLDAQLDVALARLDLDAAAGVLR